MFDGLADDWLFGGKDGVFVIHPPSLSMQTFLFRLLQLFCFNSCKVFVLGACLTPENNIPDTFASATLVLIKSVCESWNMLEVKSKCWSTL